jgi:hypothetical protein
MGATVRSLKRNNATGNLFADNNPLIEVLLIGGGGGGAGSGSIYAGSGGGGAGGLLNKSLIFPIGAFTVTVGAAGTGGASSGTQRGAAATDSSIIGTNVSLIAIAGGRGGPGSTDGGAFGGSAGGGLNLVPQDFGLPGGSVMGQGQGIV